MNQDSPDQPLWPGLLRAPHPMVPDPPAAPEQPEESEQSSQPGCCEHCRQCTQPAEYSQPAQPAESAQPAQPVESVGPSGPVPAGMLPGPLEVMDDSWCYPLENPRQRRLSAGGVRLTSDSEHTAQQTLFTRLVMHEQVIAWNKAQQYILLAQASQFPVAPSAAGPLPGGIDITATDTTEAELGTLLHLSRRAAQIRIQNAETLTRLPITLNMLAAGLLDDTRALAIAQTMSAHLPDLPVGDPRWSAVERKVTAQAATRTATQLRDDVRRAILAIDPDLADQRTQAAKLERGISFWPSSDGMSELGGLLPAEAAVAADTVLNLLADAARDAAARAGERDERTHQQRRADAFTGIFSAILDGRPLPYYPANFPHTQHQTFTSHGTTPPWTTSPSSSSTPGNGQPGSSSTSSGSGSGSESGDRAPEGSASTPSSNAPSSSANSAGPAGPPGRGEPTTGSSASAGPASSASPAASAGPATSPGPASPATPAGPANPTTSAGPTGSTGSTGSAGWPGVWSPPWMPAWWEPPSLSTRQKRRPHLVITISAETLTGWNNLPADLAGYGAITAQTARDLAHHAGTADLIILNPPPHPQPNTPPDGSPDENPDEPTGTSRPAPGGSRTPRSSEPAIKIARVFGQPAEPGYRPSTDLIRDVIAIHRVCRFPGCTRPSEQCDLDHIRSYPEGKTISSNLAPLCRHHHVLKTHGGWTLTVPLEGEGLTPGTVRWTSPLGVIHDVPPDDQPGTDTLS